MTPANDLRPTRRLLLGPSGEYVVELFARHIVIRPKGTRRNGPAAIAITPGAFYVRALLDRPSKKRRRRGGR